MANTQVSRIARLGALTAALMMALAACGGDGVGSGSGTPPGGGGSGSGSGAGSGKPSPSGGGGPDVPAPTPPAPGQPMPSPGDKPSPPAPPSASGNVFDKLYSRNFRLTRLSADPIVPQGRPLRADSLRSAFIDPAYGTRLYHATSASEGNRSHMRHEYSRRQAFNANNTRYLAQDGSGAWYLYDANTFKKIRVLKDFGGDCEAIWHPTDPRKIYLTSPVGGMVWWVYDVESDKKEVLYDFTGKTPWPQARSFWTKAEGTMSADGRYLALMATTYSNQTKQNTIYGLLMFDVLNKKIVGTLDASKFPKPGAFPDHISTSPSGKYAVPSWGKGQGGTRAYTRDFSSSKLLLDNSQHSDLAFGPNREDMYVYTDYDTGYIVARNMDTLRSFNITPIYQGDHEGYAAHISGQAFNKPGWVVVSTYSDSARHGQISPSPTLRPQYRKVFLAELKPNGRNFNVAHIRGAHASGKDYFAEPQASASRDLSRIIFTSKFGGNTPDDYIIGLPSWWDKSP